MTTPPFPLIPLSGDAATRGRLYGEQAADRIHRSVALYSGLVERNGLSRDRLNAIVQGFLGVIAAVDEDYLIEMRAIAEGARVDFLDVVMINARTEILQLAELEAVGRGTSDGCTAVVALPAITADKHLIHAQNWDWRPECALSGVVLQIRREDGPDILTFTEAGGLARCGLNAAGIALTGNYLECDRDYQSIGTPLAILRRKALEQTHLAPAIKTVATTRKSASNNMILTQADGFAVNFECAPDETFELWPEDGLLVHSNHWLSPVARTKLRDTGLESVPDSLYRVRRVAEALAPLRGRITTDDVRRALLDDWQSPYSVCMPPVSRTGSSSISATVATIVMEPARGEMHIAPLPSLGAQFTRYALAQAPRAGAD